MTTLTIRSKSEDDDYKIEKLDRHNSNTGFETNVFDSKTEGQKNALGGSTLGGYFAP